MQDILNEILKSVISPRLVSLVLNTLPHLAVEVGNIIIVIQISLE